MIPVVYNPDMLRSCQYRPVGPVADYPVIEVGRLFFTFPKDIRFDVLVREISEAKYDPNIAPEMAADFGIPMTVREIERAYLYGPFYDRHQVADWIAQRQQFDFEDNGDGTYKSWMEEMFPSEMYHSMLVPTDMIGVFQQPSWGDRSYTAASPIITDMIGDKRWPQPIRDGEMVPLVALDGQHRLYEAYKRGYPNVHVLIGDEATKKLLPRLLP